MKNLVSILLVLASSCGGYGYVVIPGPDEDTESTLQPIDPCPSVETAYPELLFCVDNEYLMAVYYDATAQQSFLAEIPPGTYRTTDARQCQFTVTEGCQISQ